MTSATIPRRLLLVRHAKSAWPDVPDHERPLAPRGRRQAPLVGAWLRARGHQPDMVLCSTARRAVQTWQLMAAEMAGSPRVTTEERIYGAVAATLLDLVRHTPAAVSTLLLVGHDPGVSDLARMLAGGSASGPSGDARGRYALDRVWAKFPTGAVAILTVTAGWAELGPQCATLAEFVIPADLER